MRHGKYLAFGLALFLLQAACVEAAAAPRDIPRPKKEIPKQAVPKRTTPKQTVPRQTASRQVLGQKRPAIEPLAFDPASKTTFITYDIGTLRMTGRSRADVTYAIGTLRMTGRAGAATYSIGTLSMSGLREP
jgi:hypothetical protein